MKFGMFYEHQIPRPWGEGTEQRVYEEALEQVELADQLGIDYAWEVEHHFLEEYSHSSAPEVFLAAAADRTEQIRLGHGIRLMPTAYNQPFRIAEQISTLDIVSDGRVEFGTGESASRVEIEGADLEYEEKFNQWQEVVEQVPNMMTMDPYPGYDGEYFSMPTRNVVPKPVQKPHPPMWMACSTPQMIRIAASLGLGALCFAFNDADDAEEWVDIYYDTLKSQCVPAGHSVNANIAMVTGFSVHEDEEEALRRGAEGFAFFNYSLGHYYGFGAHKPGYTDIWEQFQEAGGWEPFEEEVKSSSIGTPEQVREQLRGYEDAGVDQIIFIQQGGKNSHEHICDSLELFAEDVMPEFEERHDKHENEKQEELAPFIEEAFERKETMDSVDEDEVDEVWPFEREVFERTI
jgi:alkanesulfonate monooxygenase SsuD/methylene tetrahydromethanopterin reductase-like flavin-dependent oxidoreductase (luciferase family)